MKPLIIFHSVQPGLHCDDGFAAALAAVFELGPTGADYVPGIYDKPPPDVAGRDVILLDFSYKRPVLEEMLHSCRSLLVIDHHKTAAEDLAFLSQTCLRWPEWQRDLQDLTAWGTCAAIFDMEHSGAGLAWDFFNPTKHRPRFIDYIENRDLGGGLSPENPGLPKINQFVRGLRSYPQTFEIWGDLLHDFSRLLTEGEAIERFFRLRVEELKRVAYKAMLDDYGTEHGPCMVVNAPKAFASEVAGELAAIDGIKFGAVYFEASPGRFEYSLRSRPKGDAPAFDCTTVAKEFGGGGHPKAAGFTAPCLIHKPL